jgi:hypothetical protein
MLFEEDEERIRDLKLILSRVAYTSSLFDDNGITVRFMNSSLEGNNMRDESDIEHLVNTVKFKGLTPLGTSLRAKILDPFVVEPARSGQLKKPIIIITITDGQPSGKPEGAVNETIRYASAAVTRNSRYGKGACSFQFAQVGNNLKAREFLGKLNNDSTIGDVIDCTSSRFPMEPWYG